MIVIIDYGMGNLRSVGKAFERLGLEATISSEPDRIRLASKLVLPGVGHFGRCMSNLKDIAGLVSERVLDHRVPILGICMGYQLMSDWSEEGDVAGLGWIPGRTVRLGRSLGQGFKVPHMGWNTIEPRVADPLLDGVDGGPFYFAHSYHVEWSEPHDVLADTIYGTRMAAVVHRDNVWAVQFHPEKSHGAGMRLLSNFANQ